MGDSSTDTLERRENVGFAFNDNDLSDRVLHLEIIPLASNRKPMMENFLQWFRCFAAYDHSISNGSDFGNGFKLKTVHISSPILASKSPFFYKLFKNGMKESHQRDNVTIRINASEEAAFMDLLNFIYDNTLSATSADDLLDVLMIADKFEVTSCMRYCIKLLLKLPMSMKSSLFYLELPPSVSASEVVQPLIDVAKQYLVKHYNNLTKKSQEKAMRLPLSALEAVLKSDGLRVDKEDDVFDFILKWACVHYPELEERREILTKCLAGCICFPYLSCLKLKQALVSLDFDHEVVSKLVSEALFSKVRSPLWTTHPYLRRPNNH